MKFTIPPCHGDNIKNLKKNVPTIVKNNQNISAFLYVFDNHQYRIIESNKNQFRFRRTTIYNFCLLRNIYRDQIIIFHHNISLHLIKLIILNYIRKIIYRNIILIDYCFFT